MPSQSDTFSFFLLKNSVKPKTFQGLDVPREISLLLPIRDVSIVMFTDWNDPCSHTMTSSSRRCSNILNFFYSTIPGGYSTSPPPGRGIVKTVLLIWSSGFARIFADEIVYRVSPI